MAQNRQGIKGEFSNLGSKLPIADYLFFFEKELFFPFFNVTFMIFTVFQPFL